MAILRGFSDLFSGDSVRRAADAKAAGLAAGRESAYGAIDEGLSGARSQYEQAVRPFDALVTRGMTGYDAYADASGANGPEGLARAYASYRESPGFRFALDEAARAVERGQGRLGMLASGNTLAALNDRATGLALQDFAAYKAGLQPFLGAAQSAATGQAGVRTAAAGTEYDAGKTKGGIGFQTEVGIGNARADAEQADAMGAKNLFDAFLGGANLATKFLPGSWTGLSGSRRT